MEKSMEKISSVSKVIKMLHEANEPCHNIDFVTCGESFKLDAGNIVNFFVDYGINRPLITI